MNTIKRIFKKLVQGSRLKDYESILQTAIEKGYSIVSLEDYISSDTTNKMLILRHDVDIDAQGARRMFEIEKRLGARATYYFRNSTIDKILIREMQESAFETGLHYETLADYCKIYRIADAEKLGEEDFLICKDILKKELIDWENDFAKLQSICSHGDKRNRLLSIPNRVLVDDEFRSDVNISFEAYDDDILSNVDSYISDSSILHNHAWRKALSPQEAMERGDNHIVLLTHPTHWNYNIYKNIRALYKGFLEDNLNYVYKKERFD